MDEKENTFYGYSNKHHEYMFIPFNIRTHNFTTIKMLIMRRNAERYTEYDFTIHPVVKIALCVYFFFGAKMMPCYLYFVYIRANIPPTPAMYYFPLQL